MSRTVAEPLTADELARVMRHECVGVRVSRLHRLVGRRFEQALRPLGVSLSQMEILSGLTIMEHPVKPAYLAEKLAIERSTMSRNLSLMESKGLVATTEVSASGRSLSVTITELGSETLARAGTAWAEAQHDIKARIGDQAAELMDTWISEIDDAATAITQPDHGDVRRKSQERERE